MLDIVIIWWCVKAVDNYLDGGVKEDEKEKTYTRGICLWQVNLLMAYQTGDGVVAEGWHVRESLVGATASGVINSRGRGTQGGGSLPN